MQLDRSKEQCELLTEKLTHDRSSVSEVELVDVSTHDRS